jgi:hypothetical protein
MALVAVFVSLPPLKFARLPCWYYNKLKRTKFEVASSDMTFTPIFMKNLLIVQKHLFAENSFYMLWFKGRT